MYHKHCACVFLTRLYFFFLFSTQEGFCFLVICFTVIALVLSIDWCTVFKSIGMNNLEIMLEVFIKATYLILVYLSYLKCMSRFDIYFPFLVVSLLQEKCNELYVILLYALVFYNLSFENLNVQLIISRHLSTWIWVNFELLIIFQSIC